jgi:hypothetical protein
MLKAFVGASSIALALALGSATAVAQDDTTRRDTTTTRVVDNDRDGFNLGWIGLAGLLGLLGLMPRERRERLVGPPVHAANR